MCAQVFGCVCACTCAEVLVDWLWVWVGIWVWAAAQGVGGWVRCLLTMPMYCEETHDANHFMPSLAASGLRSEV